MIYTDKAGHYEGVKRERHTVNHKASEYARIVDLADMQGKATTNYTESAWSMLKRSFMGVYHKMSPKTCAVSENLHGAVEHPRSWHREPDALRRSGRVFPR